LNLPNYITLGRLFAVVGLFFLMLMTRKEGGKTVLPPAESLVAALLFVAACISDLFDGYYARKRKISSTFGKFFDPLADKMLFLTAMIMMIPLGRIPAWLVVIFFLREVTITALRGVAVDSKIVLAADHWGKYKSIFISIACTGLLMHYAWWGLEWRYMGWFFMPLALLFSLVSGINYTVKFIRGLRGV